MANIDNGVMLGALGSAVRVSAGTVTPPPGMVIVTVQIVGHDNTIVNLISEDPNKFFNTAVASHKAGVTNYNSQDHGTGGEDASSIVYPQGMAIYGRWTSVEVGSVTGSGCVIFYFGY